MTRHFLYLPADYWKDLLKQYITTSFAVFYLLFSNLQYFRLFEIFNANNVMSQCIMNSRLALIYLDMRVTINASRLYKSRWAVLTT